MKKFAVFDIDGTLIRWQLYHAIVDKLAKNNLLGDNAHSQLKTARMAWKRRDNPEAFKAYEHTLITIYESAITAIKPETFDELVEEVVEEYKDQVYTFTRDLAIDLKKQGYFLVAISGSHHELVAHIAHTYGFDDYIGTQYERINGRFTGKKFVASKNKQSLLAYFVKKHGLTMHGSYAIGDSLLDESVLAMVDHPIAFNPDKQLYQEAKKQKWPIIIERKNVIYQLHYKDGHYTLV